VQFPELSLASANDPPLKRGTIRLLEQLAGRDYFAPLYERWRSEIIPQGGREGARVIRPMLRLIEVELDVVAKEWPPRLVAGPPLVLIANHPFGIVDGIAALALAEDVGRPFRILINKDLLKVAELRPYSLPIDFEETREAHKTNLTTRSAPAPPSSSSPRAGWRRRHVRSAAPRICRGSRSSLASCSRRGRR
jgi:putative hemolysin